MIDLQRSITYRLPVLRFDRGIRFSNILCVLSLLSVTVSLQAQSGEEIFGTVFSDALNRISSYFPRFEGSQAEDETIGYIRERFDEAGIDYQVLDFDDYIGGHSFSHGLEAYISGALDDELIIAIPINHRSRNPVRGNGDARLAFGVALASSLSHTPPPLSVRFLFLGAEYPRADGSVDQRAPYPMGTNQFLDTHITGRQSVVFYLDIDFPPERTVVRAGDRGYVSPYWLVEDCSKALDTTSLYYLVRGNETQFYRLARSVNPAPLEPYLADDIPGVSFHSGGTELRGAAAETWARQFHEFTTGFLVDNDGGFPADWDRHYLFFQAKSYSVAIRERSYIALVIILLAVMILYPLIAPQRFRNYVKSLIQYPWALPLLLVLVVALLAMGTLIVRGVMAVQGSTELWTSNPAFYFILKISVATAVFAVLIRYVKRIPFPRRGRFYNAAALMLLYVDIVVLGLFDISLAYYVVWACIWAFLFSLSSSRILKAICLVASPTWFLKAAYDVFTVPEMSIARLLIFSPVKGNIVLAIIMLPFLSMLIRLDFMFRHPRRRTKRVLMTVVYSTLSIVVGSLFVYLSFFVSYNEANPQPVTLTQRLDIEERKGELEVSSPASLYGLTLVTGNGTESVASSSRSFIRNVSLDTRIIDIESESSAFLGRGKIELRLTGLDNPDDVDITIDSENELVIYDSNFPYSYDSFQKARIHIGRNPNLPLVVQFTVPLTQTGAVYLAARFVDPNIPIHLVGRPLSISRSLIAYRSFELGALLSVN